MWQIRVAVVWDNSEQSLWLIDNQLSWQNVLCLIDTLQTLSAVVRQVTIFGTDHPEFGDSSMDFTYIMEFKR